MKIEINTQEFTLPDGACLQQALELFKAQMPYAVMLNEDFIPKSSHNQQRLHEGDKVEILGAIQGG